MNTLFLPTTNLVLLEIMHLTYYVCFLITYIKN